MTNSASPTPNGASTGPPPFEREGRGQADRREHGRREQALRGGRAGRRASSRAAARTASTSKSGTNSGPNVALKNGGPTEIFSPVSASSASG